jgi:type IV pilus biogenesis/stability protein PilW
MSEILPDPTRVYLDVPPERIISLYESNNQPQVAAAGKSAQPAHATIVAAQDDDGYCEVVVALHLVGQNENVIFAGPRIAAQSVPQAIEEAVVFAESMGFMLDDLSWPRLDMPSRVAVLEKSPAFQPPQAAKQTASAERVRPKDNLAAVARLFAAFALLLAALGAGCATGMSAEQRARSAEIHYELGTNYLTNGDSQAALREYLAAVQENPELPQPHNALGLLYGFSLARPAEAEESFRTAINLDPDYSDALNNFGAFYLSRGRFGEAIPLFEKALKSPVYAARAIAECNLGWALYKNGQPDKGIARIKGALIVAPKYCKGWKQLGTIYRERNQLDEAADAFSKYAGSCPGVADAHLESGRVLVRLSRADDAKAEFEKCSKGSPDKEAAVVAECSRLLKEMAAPQ